MKIDIGGGTLPAHGYTNLDPISGEGEYRRKIQQGIPVADHVIEAVRAHHVMEHIPAGQERIDVFNEVHRVLMRGGTFEVEVPVVVDPLTWHAFADPTHVSFWVPESFHYFDGTFAAHASYGIKLWHTRELHAVDTSVWRWVGVPQK